MAKTKKNNTDDDFIRHIRENAMPKYCTASSPKQQALNPSADKVESSGDKPSERNRKDAKEVNDSLGEFDINTIHGKIFGGDNVAYDAQTLDKIDQTVTAATNVDMAAEEEPSSTYHQTETIEVAKVNDVTNVTFVAEVNETTPKVVSSKDEVQQPKVSRPKDEPATPSAKATRISAKMRKATRAEFCDAYTQKVDTKGGKPISIVPAVMERLYRLCSLSGNRNACPTYVVNNLLSEFLDVVELEAKKWGLLD